MKVKVVEALFVFAMLLTTTMAGVTMPGERAEHGNMGAATSGSPEHGGGVLSFTFSEPVVNDRGSYVTITMKGAETFTMNPGEPMLPVFQKTLIFPLGTKIKGVSGTPSYVRTMELPKKIAPAPHPVPFDGRHHRITISENSHIYGSTSPYPEEWFRYHIGVGLHDGEHVIFLTIEVYPVRYHPAAHMLEYAGAFDVEVNTDEGTPVTFNDAYDLLIVAPQKFSDELAPLVAHKESMGMKTVLATTEDIYKDQQGRDEAEKIKYYIKDALENWGITYVMLVGGMKGQWLWSWYVPVRYSHLDDNSSWEASYISDLYFADIYKYEAGQPVFDDWDSNGNGVFAEWTRFNKDILDLYPDVYVGRLPCRNEREVTAMVNKIIMYETQTHGKEWFNKMVVVGGDSFEDNIPEIGTDYIEGQVECDQALSFMDGFEHVRVYVEGGDYEFTPENAVSVLSQGEGFVYFSGHGNPTSWATHPYNDFETWIDFNLESIEQLINGEKLPVLVVGGCHNSQFNVSVLNLLKIWEGYRWLEYIWKGETSKVCWGWLMTRHEGGGSIATIGNTGLGFGTVGDGPVDEVPDSEPDGIPDVIQYLGGWMEPHFFDVYNNKGKNILGETWGTTIADYINKFPIDWSREWQGERPYTIEQIDLKTVQEWVLFGDPSLRIGGYP
ncbi:MAG: peptidase C25 [Thermoplasmata archaeon]|nr:MAG: peptidase C25 [Thermoplasmata archaeon]